MQLMTKKIREQLIKNGKTKANHKGMDSKVVVKFFNPYGRGTWLITEAEEYGDDLLLYGYCNLYDWEWGYVSFNELSTTPVLLNRFFVERDLYSSGTVRELAC